MRANINNLNQNEIDLIGKFKQDLAEEDNVIKNEAA